MSIASAIQNAQQKVANAYTAVDNKGGTLPATQDLANLPNAINTISTGGTINSLNVTPTTSAQTITASGGVDGFNPINVSAVDASIDSNIQANNILDGVTILGVTGNVEELNATSQTVTPTTSQQTLTPQSPYNAFDSVTVNAVTSAIDSDIQAGNIKSGVNILGVNGTIVELNGETRTVSLTDANGQTFTPSSGKNGITSITVTPNNQNRTVTPTTSQQSLTVNSGYSGNGTITIDAVTSAIDNSIQPENIKKDVVILGTTGTYEGSGGIGIAREVSAGGVYQMPAQSFTFSLPSNATDLGDYALFYAFCRCTGLTSVDLSSLTTISSTSTRYAFRYCTNLTSVNLSNLTTVSGEFTEGFSDCTNLTSVNLSNLTTVSGSFGGNFNNCTGLTAIDLSSLTTVSGSMVSIFNNCTNLTSVNLSNLTTVSGSGAFKTAFCYTKVTSVDLSNLVTVGKNSLEGIFKNCTDLLSVNLSGLINVSEKSFYDAFNNCTALTNVDFSSLTTASGNQIFNQTFYGCTNLATVNFNNLETIGTDTQTGDYGHFQLCFFNCTSLTSLTFPNLKKIYCTGSSASYGTFASNNKVQKMYFPKLDTITYGTGASTQNQSACKNMFYHCSALTELHFGAANQSAIEASPGYSTAWGRGAGNVTIYFDL